MRAYAADQSAWSQKNRLTDALELVFEKLTKAGLIGIVEDLFVRRYPHDCLQLKLPAPSQLEEVEAQRTAGGWRKENETLINRERFEIFAFPVVGT